MQRNEEENVVVSGIRISSIGKVYRKYPFGIKSASDVNALEDFNLEVH